MMLDVGVVSALRGRRFQLKLERGVANHNADWRPYRVSSFASKKQRLCSDVSASFGNSLTLAQNLLRFERVTKCKAKTESGKFDGAWL